MLAQKYEELEDEYHQVNIMLETEKKDKVESSQNFKEMQDLIKKIQETLGLSEEDPREHILVEIQNILERWN
jgi:predicted RND superfamily exporter protein